MNLLGTLIILAVALQIADQVFGADMGQRTMLEYPAGIKGLMLLLKNPLFILSVLGAMAGSAVMTAYAEKNRLKIFLTHTAVSIALTPLAIRMFGQASEWDSFMGWACIIGAASHLATKFMADKRIQEALIKRGANEIEHLGERKPKP